MFGYELAHIRRDVRGAKAIGTSQLTQLTSLCLDTPLWEIKIS